MKGFFAKLKDFSLKLKVSEILLFLKPQNRWKKACYETLVPFCGLALSTDKAWVASALVKYKGLEIRVSVIFDDLSPTHGQLPITPQIDVPKDLSSEMSLEVA